MTLNLGYKDPGPKMKAEEWKKTCHSLQTFNYVVFGIQSAQLLLTSVLICRQFKNYRNVLQPQIKRILIALLVLNWSWTVVLGSKIFSYGTKFETDDIPTYRDLPYPVDGGGLGFVYRNIITCIFMKVLFSFKRVSMQLDTTVKTEQELFSKLRRLYCIELTYIAAFVLQTIIFTVMLYMFKQIYQVDGFFLTIFIVS